MIEHDSYRFEPLAIFAVGDDDKAHAFEIAAAMSAWPVKRLVGSYKGVEEASFLMTLPQYSLAHGLGLDDWVKGQESILALAATDGSGKRAASLCFLDENGQAERDEAIGNWHATNRATALARDAWTYDPSTGAYYVVD